MCGIVGYVGKQETLPVLLRGMKSLEYRGYDSTGVAVMDGSGEVQCRKTVGETRFLEEAMGENRLRGNIGIGHTRWATHGGVTEINAHPHTDCTGSLWLVHNGIIENYKELRDTLMTAGHVFASQTDTEVVAHLIEQEFAIEGSLERALQKILQKIRGAYGLVLFHAREPGKLWVVRNFSPLLIGVCDDGYIVASDSAALAGRTTKVIYLEDGEMASLTAETCILFDGEGREKTKSIHEVNMRPVDGDEQTFAHFMLKEIYEIPEVIRRTAYRQFIYEPRTATYFEKLKNAKRILISACGTAYLAGKMGEYIMEDLARLPVEVDVASEFRYRAQPFFGTDFFIAISQSGETADTLSALRLAKRAGVATLAITNGFASSIAREADAVIYQNIGPEIGVASTKAFVSQVALMFFVAEEIANLQKKPTKKITALLRKMKSLPRQAEGLLGMNEAIRDLAARYQHFENFLYLGRLDAMPLAMEGALKLKEISYAHAEGYGAGEMKHGSLAMIDEGFPSVVIAPQGPVYEKVMSNIEEIRARKGPVIALATEGDKNILSLADDVIFMPPITGHLLPLVATVPLYLFAYHCAVLRGHSPDRPRNLAKSVTVE